MAFRKGMIGRMRPTPKLHLALNRKMMSSKEDCACDPSMPDPSVFDLAFKPIPQAKKKKTHRKGETPKGVVLA